MSRVHTPATLRIQARLERLELIHLRALVEEQAALIEQQGDTIAQLQRHVDHLEDVAEWEHRETMELGQRWEEQGVGHLGVTLSGRICVIAGSPPELGLSS